MNKFYLIFSNVLFLLVLLTSITPGAHGQSVKIKASPDSTLCVGDSLTLTRIPMGLGSTTSTTWYRNNLPISSDTIYKKGNLKVTDAGTYKVKVKNLIDSVEATIKIIVDTIPYYKNIAKEDPKTCGGKEGKIILSKFPKDTAYIISYKRDGMLEPTDTLIADNLGNLVLNNLSAGKYSEIKIRLKLKPCFSNVDLDSILLNNPPGPINVTIDLVPEMCFGDTIAITKGRDGGNVSVVGGSGEIIQNPLRLTTKNNSQNQIVLEFTFTDPLTKCMALDRDTVKINELPTIIVVSKEDVKCFGDSTGQITINEFASYQWSVPGETNKTITDLPLGNYSVTVKDAKGCVNTLNGIQINQPSVLKEDSLHLTLTTCFNIPETIVPSISGGKPGYIIAWTDSNGSPSNNQSVVFGDEGIYTITITDANNCKLIKEVNVTENEEIKLNITSSNGNLLMDHFCADKSIQLTAIGAQNYMWSNGKSSNVITENIDGLYSVTGSVKMNMKTCSVQKSIIIIKDPLPIITFKDEDGNQDNIFQICNGDTLNLNVSENNSLYEYQWNDPVMSVGSFRSLKDTAIYPIAVTESSTGCINIDSVELKFKNTRYVNIVTADNTLPYDTINSFCRNENVITFYINGNVGQGQIFLKNQWQLLNENTDSINKQKTFSTNLINHFNDFIIIASANDSNNCPSTDTIYFNTKKPETDIFERNYCGLLLLKPNYYLEGNQPENVNVYPNGFYYINGSAKLSYKYIDPFGSPCHFIMSDPFINENTNSYVISDNLIYDECGPFLLAKYKPNFCYTWYQISKDGKTREIVNGQDSSWFKNPDTLRYTYVAIAYDCNNDCDTAQISTRSDDGGKSIPCYNSGESAIKIYPNPNQGHMYLKLEGLPAGKQEVFIYDMMGRQVYKKTIDHTGNNDITELSLSQLTDGIYFAKTYYNGTGISTKFIITH